MTIFFFKLRPSITQRNKKRSFCSVQDETWYFWRFFHAESEFGIHFGLVNCGNWQNGLKVAKNPVLGPFWPPLPPKWGKGGHNQILRFKPWFMVFLIGGGRFFVKNVFWKKNLLFNFRGFAIISSTMGKPLKLKSKFFFFEKHFLQKIDPPYPKDHKSRLKSQYLVMTPPLPFGG